MRHFSEIKKEFNELAETIGLKNSLQQMAVGAALCIILLAACGLGEWLNRLAQ